MADIFISYSKSDRLIVEQLAAFLEAEGWSVWWDKSLAAGDTYRDEIMRELAAARVVISVWTPASITSDWVRAEAGRAKADGKLIPVKTADVGYDAIPLPFGEMHTEPVENRAQVRAAVVAQLAKPAETPKGLWMAWAETRYAIITWIGIIGGAITLFSNFKGVIQFADWARLLVDHWQVLAQAVWSWVFGWIGIQISAIYVPVLTLCTFLLASVVSGRLRLTLLPRETAGMRAARSSLTWRGALRFIMFSFLATATWFVVSRYLQIDTDSSTFFSGTLILGLFMIFGCIFWCSDKVGSLISAVAAWGVSILMCGVPLLGSNSSKYSLTEAIIVYSYVNWLMVAFAPVALSLVPARILNRRFLFLLIGLGLLLGLNEISKLELWRHLKA